MRDSSRRRLSVESSENPNGMEEYIANCDLICSLRRVVQRGDRRVLIKSQRGCQSDCDSATYACLATYRHGCATLAHQWGQPGNSDIGGGEAR